jgi:hypothetical protein
MYCACAICFTQAGDPKHLYDALMPMKVTTVRFSETLYSAIEEQARREGVSTAQFIREAAILRLGQLMAAEEATAAAMEEAAATARTA